MLDQLKLIIVRRSREYVMMDAALYADFDLFRIEWLDDVIKRAHLHRLNRALNFCDFADDYYGRGRSYYGSVANYGIAINFGHHQVSKNDRIAIGLDFHQRLLAVISVVAQVILRQETAHQVTGVIMVVYDEKRRLLQKGLRLIRQDSSDMLRHIPSRPLAIVCKH